MNESPETDLDDYIDATRNAYFRFMKVSEILRRHGLTSVEISKAKNIQNEAFGILTINLERMTEIWNEREPRVAQETERLPAPRYSTEWRRYDIRF